MTSSGLPATKAITSDRVSADLDLIRGLAAVAVLVYHVRYRLFLDYADLSDRSWLGQIFYTLTAFGHDAVMVFFVLSGYFIVGSVLRDHASRRWSWSRYLASRLSRLYVVLLPGLLLTAVWDLLGLQLHPANPIYTGAPATWTHDYFPVQDRLNAKTLFANAAFLQTIVAAPFGSNEPLWSLSYEFWYYLLFPLMWLAVRAPFQVRSAIVTFAFSALLISGVARPLLLYFPIWLMGGALVVAPRMRIMRRPHTVAQSVLAASVFVVILAATHVGPVRRLFGGSIILTDYFNASCFAVVLYFLLQNETTTVARTYAKASAALAAFSYTLYVTHAPLIVFIRSVLQPGEPWVPDATHVVVSVLIASLCLVYAYAISRVTEARTPVVRDALTQVFGKLSR